MIAVAFLISSGSNLAMGVSAVPTDERRAEDHSFLYYANQPLLLVNVRASLIVKLIRYNTAHHKKRQKKKK